MHRSSTGRVAAVVLLAALMLFATACGDSKSDKKTGGNTTTTAGADALGTPNPATGSVVKVGFISDGKSQLTDNSADVTAAQASVSWLNEYQGGLGGHKIELVTCETNGDTAKAGDCAQQMIQAGVVAVTTFQLAAAEAAWKPINDAKIPFLLGQAQSAVVKSNQNTFVLANSEAVAVDIPLGVAQKADVKKAAVAVIDVPGAAETYEKLAGQKFKDAGITLSIIKIPPGTADMTSQLSPLATDGTGLVNVIGPPDWCATAFNALSQTGYKGKITSLNVCFDANGAKLNVPGDVLEGIVISTPAPSGTNDPSLATYTAVMNKYAPSLLTSQRAPGVFQAVTALQIGFGDSKDATTTGISTALRAMPEKELQAAAGMKFRCSGKADTASPAICTTGAIVGTLDAQGQPTSFEVVGSTPIPG